MTCCVQNCCYLYSKGEESQLVVIGPHRWCSALTYTSPSLMYTPSPIHPRTHTHTHTDVNNKSLSSASSSVTFHLHRRFLFPWIRLFLNLKKNKLENKQKESSNVKVVLCLNYSICCPELFSTWIFIAITEKLHAGLYIPSEILYDCGCVYF